MSKIMIICGTAIVCFLIAAITWLTAIGKDANALMGLVNLVVVPTLAALVWGKLHGMEEKTEAIRQQTNGTQSRLLDAVTGMNPPASAAPADITQEIPRYDPGLPGSRT